MYSGISYENVSKSRFFSFRVLLPWVYTLHTASIENGVSSAVRNMCDLLSQIEILVYSANEISQGIWYLTAKEYVHP
jgi:hypothetical protein